MSCHHYLPQSPLPSQYAARELHIQAAVTLAAATLWLFSALSYILTKATTVDNAISKLALANEDFASALYQKLAAKANPTSNILYSPANVFLALGALSVGARGESQKAIFSAMGLGSQLTQEQVNQAFSTLLSRRASNKDVNEGTAVFVDDQFNAKPKFLEQLKRFYLSQSFKVDFGKTRESANIINGYVADKTHGKIDKLVTEVDPSAVVYLLSFIYYKGQWAKTFDSKLTKQDVFNVDRTTQVPVQMMQKEDHFFVYDDKALRASILRLDFSRPYFMLFVLPDNVQTVEKALNAKLLNKWISSTDSRRYKIYIPKFSIKTSYTLNEVLTNMGMGGVFSDHADLSGIAEGKRLKVSKVVHQASLDVDEEGATAAAGTGITIVPLFLLSVPVLKFNRPFLFVIIESTTNAPLFMGRIANPTM